MGRLCREKDWAATSLGPVDDWPQSLKTAAAMVIGQGFAQALCWGPDLLQIYNDSYRKLLGNKHPGALGRPMLENRSEIRDEIEPLLEEVLRGETVYREDLLLRVARRGFQEDGHFTFSYGPVRDESGEVAGVLITSIETTLEMLARPLRAERDRLLGELALQRSHLEYAFHHAPAFLAILRGPDHVFESTNAAFDQLTGLRTVLGKPLREALPEVADQGFVDLLDGVLGLGEPFVGREVSVLLTRSPRQPLEERFIDISCVPIRKTDGTRSGVIFHGADVTDTVLARLEAEQAREQAEIANRAKMDFLAAMSHDFRTPLHAISGYIDLLALGVQGPVNEAQHLVLSRVKANQRHLTTLVNDVLTYAKLEAGQLTFDLQVLAADQILQSMHPLVSPFAQEKGIELTIEDPVSPLHLHADEERVRQILVNVVGNAIKFTPGGGRVLLTCEEDEDWVDLHVSDTGPGIATEQQQEIFEPFVQGARDLDNPVEGVGLGLTISRNLARAMGGDLYAESESEEGSTFSLRLPVADPVAS